MRIFKDERGISNLIATLILIAVAVVGGAFAYTAFRNQAQSTTTSADLQVQDISVVKTNGDVYASATIKNVGTQQLLDIEVTIGILGDTADNDTIILDKNLSDHSLPATLDPGQTASASDDSKGNDLSAGVTYPVRIEAGTPDGGSITKTMTVRVKS